MFIVKQNVSMPLSPILILGCLKSGRIKNWPEKSQKHPRLPLFTLLRQSVAALWQWLVAGSDRSATLGGCTRQPCGPTTTTDGGLSQNSQMEVCSFVAAILHHHRLIDGGFLHIGTPPITSHHREVHCSGNSSGNNRPWMAEAHKGEREERKKEERNGNSRGKKKRKSRAKESESEWAKGEEKLLENSTEVET